MIAAGVVDSSIALKWILLETDSDLAARLGAVTVLHAPDILFLEAGNVLRREAELGRLTRPDIAPLYTTLLRAPLIVERSAGLVLEALTFALRLKHRLNDCLFLALSARLGLPLVTADTDLIKKSKRIAGPPVLSLAEAVA